MYTIYALRDPRTNEVRYVGATQLSLTTRLEFHLADIHRQNQGSPRVQWLRELAEIELDPCIGELAIIDTDDSCAAGAEEQAWIERCRREGCSLLNVRRGGGGLRGHRRSKKKRSAITRLNMPRDSYETLLFPSKILACVNELKESWREDGFLTRGSFECLIEWVNDTGEAIGHLPDYETARGMIAKIIIRLRAEQESNPFP